MINGTGVTVLSVPPLTVVLGMSSVIIGNVVPSIAATVIGGISFTGGSGSYWGAVGDSILLVTLIALLVTFKMGEIGKKVVFGLVLIVLLALDVRRSRGCVCLD